MSCPKFGIQYVTNTVINIKTRPRNWGVDITPVYQVWRLSDVLFFIDSESQTSLTSGGFELSIQKDRKKYRVAPFIPTLQRLNQLATPCVVNSKRLSILYLLHLK